MATTRTGIEAALFHASVCTLSEFPDHAVFDGSEMLACVRLPLRGGLRGAGVLALDPHGVMHLVGRRQQAPDPGLVPRYLELGSALVTGLTSALARALDTRPDAGPPELVEGPVVPCILGTHALPDTVVVSCGIRLALGDTSHAGVAYLLFDSKLVGRLVGVLTG